MNLFGPQSKIVHDHTGSPRPASQVVQLTRGEVFRVAITLRRDVARPSEFPLSGTLIEACAFDGMRLVRPEFLGNTAHRRATSRRSVMATKSSTTYSGRRAEGSQNLGNARILRGVIFAFLLISVGCSSSNDKGSGNAARNSQPETEVASDAPRHDSSNANSLADQSQSPPQPSGQSILEEARAALAAGQLDSAAKVSRAPICWLIPAMSLACF